MFSLSLQMAMMVERKQFLQKFVCKNGGSVVYEFWVNAKTHVVVFIEKFIALFSNFS